MFVLLNEMCYFELIGIMNLIDCLNLNVRLILKFESLEIIL